MQTANDSPPTDAMHRDLILEAQILAVKGPAKLSGFGLRASRTRSRGNRIRSQWMNGRRVKIVPLRQRAMSLERGQDQVTRLPGSNILPFSDSTATVW